MLASSSRRRRTVILHRIAPVGLGLCLAAAGLALLPSRAQAATYSVTTQTDLADTTPGDGICDVAGGGCSLRAAIHTADDTPGATTITVPAGTYTLTIAPTAPDDESTGDLNILNTSGVTITGAGSGSTIIDGNGDDHVFNIDAAATTIISGVTIRNGDTTSGPIPDVNGGGILSNGSLTLTDSVVSGNNSARNGAGGGVAVEAGTATLSRDTFTANTTTGGQGAGVWVAGTATIDRSSISNNTINTTAGEGAGLDVDGTATVTNSTISGNSLTVANSFGGGVSIDGTLSMTNDTVSGNSVTGAGSHGGGIDTWGNPVTLTNVTLAGNSAPAGANLSGSTGGVASSLTATTVTNSILSNPLGGGTACESNDNATGGSNIVSDASCATTGTGDKASTDPQLGALANNGGTTLTQLPQSGSPAIDAVKNTCPPPATDQRGTTRPQGAACDIGAVEVVPAAATATATPTSTPTATASSIPVPATGVVPGGSGPGMLLTLVGGGILTIAAAAAGRRRRRDEV